MGVVPQNGWERAHDLIAVIDTIVNYLVTLIVDIRLPATYITCQLRLVAREIWRDSMLRQTALCSSLVRAAALRQRAVDITI